MINLANMKIFKCLVVSAVSVILLPMTSWAGVKDIQSMVLNVKGEFNVVCTDGRYEEVSSENITANLVCRKDSDSATHARQKVTCTGNEFMDWFYVTRVSDNKQIGDRMSSKNCIKVIKAARNGVVCTGSEFMDWFYVTRIIDEKQLDGRMSLKTCLEITSVH
jgi:hypothetical protein